jgi:hypothetical protein
VVYDKETNTIFLDKIFNSYYRGLEDGLELVLGMCRAKSKEESIQAIQGMLTMLKEKKLNNLNELINCPE